uniref:Nodule-specific cysteine-rich peptide L45 n=1 Tax=Lens culinaris TaxID=3864 RepID=A0A7T8IGF0_LENCU|nr:nodule-specific cysteine-rich peptide L45 [Lens culinaris]
MTGIVKFIYIMIIFNSILLVSSHRASHPGYFRCKQDTDCINRMCMPPKIVRCANNICTCAKVTSLLHHFTI